MPKCPSLNDYYGGKHWAARKKDVDAIKKDIALRLLEKHPIPKGVSRFTVSLIGNVRLDIDNRIVYVKLLVDALRAGGYVVEDSPKHFFHMDIDHNADLPAGQIKARITLYG